MENEILEDSNIPTIEEIRSEFLEFIFPDGRVQFGGVEGWPSEFPLTDAEKKEIENAKSD